MELQSQGDMTTSQWLNLEDRDTFIKDLFDGLINQDYDKVDPKYLLVNLKSIEVDLENFRNQIYGDQKFNEVIEPLIRHLQQIDNEITVQTDPFAKFYFTKLFSEEYTNLNFKFIINSFGKELDSMAEILQPYLKDSLNSEAPELNKYLFAFVFLNITLPLISPNTNLTTHLIVSSAIVLNYIINKKLISKHR